MNPAFSKARHDRMFRSSGSVTIAVIPNNEHTSRLNAVDARAVFLLETGEIEWLMPPCINMGLGKPPLQQLKVRPFECAE